MHRRFGPGWNSLSEEERERFRAGMNQWQSRDGHCGKPGDAPTEPPTPNGPR